MLRFESLLDCRLPSDVALTPAGDEVAFVVRPGSHPVGQPALQQLWVGRLEGGEPRPLPGDGAAQTLPAWSHDGERLAFACDRGHPGQMAPWVREPSGELRAVGELEGSVEALAWATDSSALLLLASDPGADRAGAHGATKAGALDADAPDPAVRRPGQGRRRLHRMALEDGAAAEVGPPGLNVWEVGWSGSGEAVAVVSPDPGESAWYDAAIALLDLGARTHRVVYEPQWQVQSPAISPDGRHVAFVEGWASDRAVMLGPIMLLELATGEARVLAADLDVQQLRWLEDGSIFYVGQAGVGTTCGRVTLDGTVAPIWSGQAMLGRTHAPHAAVSADGSVVAAVKEAPGEPPEVMALAAAAGDADWRPVTNLNDHLRALAGPRAERVTWQSDGLEIEGILLTPRERGEARLPVVVVVHGGPANAWTMCFNPGYESLAAPLAERGYAVLLPNPRGSTGRGQAFARANIGCHGPAELADIVAGVESLHAAGIADRERAGITGVSAGGYLTAYASTRSHAFRAAVPMACISNWLSFHFTSNVGRFDEILLDGDPYAPDGNHVRLSPVVGARTASTPTLILHGARDLCTPPGQAQELYQALVEAGVEAEHVEYEHAGHVRTEREYLLDMWARVSEWFDRHLAPDPDSDDER